MIMVIQDELKSFNMDRINLNKICLKYIQYQNVFLFLKS